jgi:Fe-S cluster assembly protein SufD
MSHPSVEITVQENKSTSIIEHYLSLSEEDASFQNSLSKITLDKKAQLDYSSVHQNNHHSLLLKNTQFHLKEKAQLNCFLLPLTAKLNHLQVNIQLQEKHAKANVYGLGDGKFSDHLDCYLTIDHLAAHCESHAVFRGIFDDNAHGAVTGKIHIAKNTPKTAAHFGSKNILLSHKSNAFVRPQLEVNHDDVQCTHGATIGSLDEDALFYLQSRGIERKTAQALLLKAFLDPILKPIKRSLLCGILKKFDKISLF